MSAEVATYQMVPANKEFKFKALCPYCKGDLTYECEGWDEDENGLWMSDGSFDMNCSTEPNMDSPDWEPWFQTHSEMPYVHQLPVDQAVKAFINKKYRFIIE